jgi:membrane associated rhomboid family serine protease
VLFFGLLFDKLRLVKNRLHPFGSAAEAIVYPLLLLAMMWTMLWAEHQEGADLIQWGIRPQHFESWKGVIFMPLLHSTADIGHIINNSVPTFMLLAALVFYYREIALKVFLFSWFGTGLSVLLLAPDNGGYHIGMSGVVYALFGFLFISGFFRNFRPLQVLSLFVVFIYGSMIWGIFPQKENISWEGHFSGLIIGVFLAVWYRKLGPKRPKYQFEIEKELGIEPPDFEGQWLAHQEALQRMREEMEQQQQQAMHVVYHYKPTSPRPVEDTPPGDNDPQP